MWLTRLRCRCTQPPISRSLGNRISGCATGLPSTSVDPSESASSDAVTVGDDGASTSSEGAGDPSGV